MPDEATASQGATVNADKKPRVSCPSCGKLLLRITNMPTTGGFEIKCKAGGCHKIIELRFENGRPLVAPVQA